jgi:hypothetical protein
MQAVVPLFLVVEGAILTDRNAHATGRAVGRTYEGLQGSGHSARRVGVVDRLSWGFVATETLLLAWGAS